MRTRNLAVMFTDIAAFTEKTSRQTREENARMLRRHDALVLPVVRAFRGRRVKSIGDALLLVFESPTDSVVCGMAVQDRLWDYNRRVPEAERLEVRVAVNLGEVRLSQGLGGADVHGEPVNVAARVEAEARPGEVWFTESVYLAMNRAEAPAEDLGYRALRGLPEPVRLYRAARAPCALGASASAPGPLPEPPYGNLGLDRVPSLAPPDPAALDRAAARAERLESLLSRIGSAPAWLAAAPRRRLAAALALAAAAAAAGLLLGRSPALRAIEAGRLDEARALVAGLRRERGEGDAEVLYLRARLEQERLRRGTGGSREEMLELYGRAARAGSGAALEALAESARSRECAERRGAARALGASGRRDALPALRRLADAEPEVPTDPLAAVRRLLGAEGRCGDGDLAREAIRELEENP